MGPKPFIGLLRSSKFDVHPENCWAAAVLTMIFVMDQNCGDPAVVRTLYKTATYMSGDDDLILTNMLTKDHTGGL